MRRLLVACALLSLLARAAAAQEDTADRTDDAAATAPEPARRAEPADVAPEVSGNVEALRALVEVEHAVLDGAIKERLANLEDQRAAALEQTRASIAVGAALRAMSAARESRKDLSSARDAHANAEQDLARANQALAGLARSGEELRAAIAVTSYRLQLLMQALEDARSHGTPAVLEPLTGIWDVTLAPTGDRGVFKFAQSGTLVGGSYTLATGRVGSFQGTFVDGRVQVDRVDSASGRDVTYYGRMSDDALTIKGSWEARSLGTGQPAFGSWVATKRLPAQ